MNNSISKKLQAMSPSKRLETLENLAKYLADDLESDRLIQLLTNFYFITTKIAILDVEPLIEDYDLIDYPDLPISAEDKSDLKAIQKIYRLTITLGTNLPGLEDWLEQLKKDSTSKQMFLEYSNSSTYREIQNQLASQLWGRFFYSSSSQMVRSLLEQARDSQKEPWLRPVFPTLTNPSSYLERVLTGHQSNITAIAITPDGKYLISGEKWGIIILWDLEKVTFITRFDDHKSPQIDYDYVAASAQIRIGDNYIIDILVTLDSKYFISGSYDGTLIVWDLEKRIKLHELVHDDHKALQQKTIFRDIWENSRKYRPDTVDADNFISKIYEWRGKIGQVIHSFTLNCENTKIIANYYDGSFIVWDIKTGNRLNLLSSISYNYGGLSDQILRSIPNSNKLILKTSSGHINIYELNEDSNIDYFGCIEINDDEISISFNNFVTAKNGEIIILESNLYFWIWSVKSRDVIEKIEIQNKDYIRCLELTPDCKWLISISSDQTLIVTDISTSKVIANISEQAIRGEWKIVVSPDGKNMIGYVGDKNIKIWDLKKLEGLFTNKEESEFGRSIYDILFTPDGNKLVLAKGEYKLAMLDCENNFQKLLEIDINNISNDKNFIRGITSSPNSQKIISSSQQGNIHLWDISSGKFVLKLSFNALPNSPAGFKVKDIAITPDAKYIITTSANHSLHVWELKQIKILKDGQIVVQPSLYKELVGHTDKVISLIASPKGKLVISRSNDGTVKVWDIDTGKVHITFSYIPVSSVSEIGLITISSDENQIFCVDEREPEIIVLDIKSQQNAITLNLNRGEKSFGDSPYWPTPGHKQPITDIVLSPDNRYLVTCSYHESTIMLWDLHDLHSEDPGFDGDEIKKYRPKFLSSTSFDSVLRCCAISPDGRTLAVGDNFSNVHILQIENVEFEKPIDLNITTSEGITFEDNIVSFELYKEILILEKEQSISKFPRLKLFIFNCFIPFTFIIVNSLTQIEQISTYLLNLIPPYFNLSFTILSIREILVLSITFWLCASVMRVLAGKTKTNLNRISENIESTFKGLLFLFLAYFITPILVDIGSTNARNLASKEYWIIFIVVSFFVFIFTKIERYVKSESLDFMNPIVFIGSSLSPLLGSHQILGSIYWSAVFSILFPNIINASNGLRPLKKVVYLISISCGIVFALVMNHFLNSDSVYWDATIRVILGIFIWNIAFDSKNPPVISLILGAIIGIIVNTLLEPTFLKLISSNLINICSIIGFLLGGILGLIGAWIIAAAIFGLFYILFILPLSIVDEGLQRFIFQIRPRSN